jgi:tetratricopeptide (TPR) repeat protein
MKTLLSLVLLLLSVSGLLAQTAPAATPAPAAAAPTSSLLLKNGQVVPADGLQRNGDMLTVTVKTPSGGTGQIAFQVSDVAQLTLPAPPALATALDLLAKGHADQALAQIDPIVAFQETLRDIPGNWWTKTALVKSSALVALNRAPEAVPVLKDIMSYSNDPETQLAAKLQMALIAPPKDPTEALAGYDAVIAQSFDAKTLTQAWIAEGDIHFAQHEFDEALLAYLTVPVFYPDHNPLVPRALWGVAQSYAKLKDTKNQEKTLNELVTDYPDTPEASLAKAELMKKKENKT